MMLVAVLALALAAVPGLLFLANLRRYRPAPAVKSGSAAPAVSVLIPARNEEHAIGAAVEAALASVGVTMEVLVLDDHSSDATARRVAELAARDPRVRLETSPAVPAGWCGKQHACWILAQRARHPLLAFIDADVRLEPAGLVRLAAFLDEARAVLVSGIPLQKTQTFLEKLLIPLIHFVLLGFLPLAWMRTSRRPAYGAGCGQLLLARREAYDTAGGHAGIRASLHDGITLPRLFRKAGFRTDLCDATDLACCRMYRGAGQVWQGLAKNATEGLARPALIVPMTLLLLGGQVLPVVLVVAAPWLSPAALAAAVFATFLLYLPRLLAMRRFRQSALGTALHPFGVVVLLAIQWYALLRSVLGKPAVWKGRAYLGSGDREQVDIR